MPLVALATCEQFPELDHEDQLIAPALAEIGIDSVPAVWTDPSIDWSGFDMVVIRATWDYIERRDEFVDWLHRVESVSRLFNPAAVIEWNTDKHYLQQIEAAELSVVDTEFFEPGADVDSWTPPVPGADYVVKPAVSCGSRDTIRYSADAPLDVSRAHIARLLDEGRAVMVQPYLEAVDTVGETAVVFLGGEYSHAIRKGALLQPDIEGEKVEGLFVQEQIDPREATPNELVTARAVLDVVPGGAQALLYARVDLIPDEFGAPRVLELELCEPSLFLSHYPEAPGRIAAAIAARLQTT